MIRSLLVVMLSLLAAAAARAQSPAITVTPSPIVFGCSLPGEDSVRYITIRNIGASPIAITGYRAAAPFLVPSPRNVMLAPGESTLDSVRFLPLIAPGNPSVMLVVETSDGELEVPMSGEIGLEPSIGPSMTRIPYEDVTVGTTKDTCITIHNQSCRDLRIDSIVVNGVTFNITKGFTTPYILRGFAEDEFCISFTPNAPGPHTGRVTFYGDLGKRTSIPLDGRGVRAEVVAEVSDVDFGSIDLGATSRDTIIHVTNRGSEFATIEAGLAITGANPGDFTLIAPTLPLLIGPTERVPLTIRFRPTAAGPRTARIVVNNSTDADPVITLRGFGSTFDVTATPDTIDMGAVYIGSSRIALDTVIVTNRSTRDVDLRNTATQGGDASSFAVLGFLTFKIARGTSYALDIRFAPLALGPLETELVGTLDNGSTFRVVLRGFGLDTAAPRPRRIVGDSLRMRVGERRAIRFAIEPPFEERDSVRSITILMRMDPLSLYPHKVSAGGVAVASRSYASDGLMEMTLSASRPFAVDGFDVEVEGLFTGRPRNLMTIEEVDVGNPQIGMTTTPGVVLLDGCDIDESDSLARAVRILAVAPNPTIDARVVVRCVATRAAVVRVIAADGHVATERMVDGALSGAVQELVIDGLASGRYIVEIVSGAARDHTILIVNQ